MPKFVTVPSHDSGEKELSVPRNMRFGALLFLLFFFPLFVVIYGLARGKHLGIVGVSLLFHYIRVKAPTKENEMQSRAI